MMPPVAPQTQDEPFSPGPHFLPLQAPDGETQPMTDVDLFVSTKRVKVLTAGSQVLATLRRVPGWTRSSALSPSGLSLQEALMDHALQTVSYTADIGPVLVLMARRRLARSGPQNTGRRLYRMICHVFHAEDVSPGWGVAPYILPIHPVPQNSHPQNFPSSLIRPPVGYPWESVLAVHSPKHSPALPPGPADRPGYRAGLCHGLQPVPAGQRPGPQPGGSPAEPGHLRARPPAQRGPGPLLQQRKLQGGEPCAPSPAAH